MDEPQKSEIIFLGLCERAAYIRDGNTNVFKWNVIGLKNIVLSYIYPLRLDGWSIGFAILPTSIGTKREILITDDAGNEIGRISVLADEAPPDAEDAVLKREAPTVLAPAYGWATAFLPLGDGQIVIQRAGLYHLQLETEDGPIIIGQLRFAVVNPPPLTPERAAAIRSEPNAAKAVRIVLGCKKCPTKLKCYSALDRIEKSENEGWLWYETLPAEFTCECGATTMGLDILRRNLHGVLGYKHRGTAEASFVPLYEKSSIESIRREFARLLDARPREELLQKFIQENLILFHQFPAEQIFSKPQILTSFVADFGIVTPQRELILIELEKTTTRLMKSNGGIAAPLNHAFDQVRNWLHVVAEHRLAVLDSLKINRDEVSSIRGVVVAGRDEGYDAGHLRRLKGMDWGPITFLTYDDLLFALDALLRRMYTL